MTKFSCEIECCPGFEACIDNGNEMTVSSRLSLQRRLLIGLSWHTATTSLGESSVHRRNATLIASLSQSICLVCQIAGHPDCVVINMLSNPIGYWQGTSCFNNYHCFRTLFVRKPPPSISRFSANRSMSPAPTTCAAQKTGSCPAGRAQHIDQYYRISKKAMAKIRVRDGVFSGLGSIHSRL